ncbi:hypothetical protein [Microbacterium pumilum]|uniref:Lipoprotein n=1 Tax=Microbacterium pumilum TaxID=344165 RepID=A0ABP5DN91_9MICO
MARTLIAAGALLLLSLTACSGAPMADSTQPTSSRPPFQTTTPGPVTTPGVPAEVPTMRWDAIVADLSERGVMGTPELVEARAVTWNSSALGCPKPGMSYTQALVDGMQVIVTVDGARYDYRFGRTDSPKLCER